MVSLPPNPARNGRSSPLEKLDGTVEMDETYVGGKKIGYGRYAGKKNKEVVIGIRQRGGELRFFHAEDAKSGTLAKYIRENISGDVDVIVTDEFSAYPFALEKVGMPKGEAQDDSAQGPRVRARRHSHEYRRVGLQPAQARHHGHVASCICEASPCLP